MSDHDNKTNSQSTSMSLDIDSDEIQMSQDSENRSIQDVVLPGSPQNSLMSDAERRSTCFLYLDLRYKAQQPLSIPNNQRLQEISRRLGPKLVTKLEHDWSKGMAEENKKAEEEELRRKQDIQRHIDEEIRAAQEGYNALGYDPLSKNLTKEQEAIEKVRCMDAAQDIFEADVLGRQDEDHAVFHLVPTNNPDEFMFHLDSTIIRGEGNEFNLTAQEIDELIQSSFNDGQQQQVVGSEILKEYPFDGNPRKRSKLPPTLQHGTPMSPSLTHETAAELVSTEGGQVKSSRPTTTKRGTLPRDKTVKKVFAAVEQHSPQNPGSPSKTSSRAPKSADWSWGNSNAHPQLAPAPSPRNIFGGGPIHSREAQDTTAGDLLPRPLFHRGHQRHLSSPNNSLAPIDPGRSSIPPSDRAISSRNPPRGEPPPREAQHPTVRELQPHQLSFHRGHQRHRSSPNNFLPPADSFRSSFLPSDRAGSPPRKQPHARNQGIQQATSFFGLPTATRDPFEEPRTPTRPRIQTHQPDRSGGSANMSSQVTPTTENTVSQASSSQQNTPTRKGLPPAPSSLPRRPPGPLPSFHHTPVPKLNYGARSPPPPSTNLREFASITFQTRVGREHGIKLWQGIENYQDEKFKAWRKAHPRYKEFLLVPDFAPESKTLELCGPVMSNVRGALHQLFDGKYAVNARMGEL